MTILATNLGGPFGGVGGSWRAGETKEVTMQDAARLTHRYARQFSITPDADDLALREDGRVRYLGYFGPVDSRFGYGGAGITILRALTRLGIEAAVNPHYNNGHEAAYLGDLPKDAQRHLGAKPFIPQVQLVHCLPNDLPRAPGPRNIAWTMWETSRIPNGSQMTDRRGEVFGDWAAHLNTHAERLIVPCPHNAQVFADCGVKLPITVLPYGLDTDIWPYHERRLDRTGPFLVFQYGDLTSRKGVEEAAEAFRAAFGQQKDVQLVLKTQGGILKQYIEKRFNDPRIIVIDETWPRAQLVELLHMADAFIWLSRGEGFGLPPLQAALTGLPVITTTHTGMETYYRPDLFYGVDNAGMSPSPMGGEWYEPSVEHAAVQLRAIYENRAAAFARGKEAANYVRSDFSLDAFAARLGTFAETL